MIPLQFSCAGSVFVFYGCVLRCSIPPSRASFDLHSTGRNSTCSVVRSEKCFSSIFLAASLILHTSKTRQNNYSNNDSDSFLNALCSYWKPLNISHAGIPDDAALVHLLANAMHHKDNVCGFRRGVLRCCLFHVSTMETRPTAGG